MTEHAPDGGAVLTAELITTRWRPVEVRVSPDGGRVAWTARRAGSEDDHDETAVWVADVDGEGMGRRWTWSGGDRMPRWSPDGRRLAFLSDRVERGRHDLYVVDLDGGEARPLHAGDRAVTALAWSPTGERIAVVAEEDRSEEERRREDERDDRTVAGDTRPGRIWLVDAASGERTGPLPVDEHVAAVDWSPDGASLAAIVAPSADPDEAGRSRVVVIPVDGGPVTDVGPAPFADGLCWSGDRLVWVGFHETNPVSALTVWSAAATEGSTPVVIGPRADEEACALQVRPLPAGRVAILTLSGLDTRMQWVDATDGATDGGPGGEGWSPDGDVVAFDVAISHGELILAAAWSPGSGPEEVWVGRPGALRPVSDHHGPLAGIALGAVHDAAFTGADGRPFDGVVVLPPGRTMGDGPLPLVVLPHGGPYGHAGRNLHLGPLDWAQWLAADGIAAVLPNYRGSVGRGQAGAASVRGDMGGAEWGDVLTAVDDLVRRGVADPDRLGIGGWSQGGFLSAWAVTRTDRFRAAVVGAGVTDWAMLALTNDLPSFEAALAGDGRPWDPEQRRRSDAQSPITGVDRVSTPTLLLHGERDERVPVSQARAFWLGLRARGVPTELVTYPREPHGIRERRHQEDILARVRAWYRRWLLGTGPDQEG